MSYVGTNMASVAEALKSFYLDGLRYQLNDQASAFLAQVEKTSEGVVGKDIVMALRYGRTGGIGNRADDGELPNPNARKTKQAKWETKNFFARFRITDKTIEASKSNVGAFANMLETEISDAETDAKLDLSRQVLGDGTGKLATLSANSTYTAGTPAYLELTLDSVMYFAEGMYVDLYAADNSAVTNGAGLEVILVDDANSKIRVAVGSDIHSNVVATGYVVLAGNKGLELTGVAAVFATSGSIYNLDRAAYPWLVAQVKALNGEISENVIQERIDLCETRTGSVINYMQCALGVRRAYIDLLSATKQTVNTLDMKGGFKALSYNGTALVADKYIPAGQLQLLDLNDWAMYRMADFNWMDRDGSIMSRVANRPAWEATLVKYCDIGCQRPRGQGLITGITEH